MISNAFYQNGNYYPDSRSFGKIDKSKTRIIQLKVIKILKNDTKNKVPEYVLLVLPNGLDVKEKMVWFLEEKQEGSSIIKYGFGFSGKNYNIISPSGYDSLFPDSVHK